MVENPKKGNVNHKNKRILVTTFVVLMGIGLSAIFTTNVGWILFDLIDHYISSYIIIAVGFMQCVAVGWLFEYESTALVSPNHTKSLKYLGYLYWIPIMMLSFYTNAAFSEEDNLKYIGILLMVCFTVLSWIVSFMVSSMPFNSWFHEILLCGVDKLSMSVTSLSNGDGSRSWWMIPFEFYFGVSIKFFNPAALTFMFFQSLI